MRRPTPAERVTAAALFVLAWTTIAALGAVLLGAFARALGEWP